MLAGNSQLSPTTFYSLFLFPVPLVLSLLWNFREQTRFPVWGNAALLPASLSEVILPTQQLSTFTMQTIFQYHSLAFLTQLVGRKRLCLRVPMYPCQNKTAAPERVPAVSQSRSHPGDAPSYSVGTDKHVKQQREPNHRETLRAVTGITQH